MRIILPYALDSFPKTEDLLVLLTCKNLFAGVKAVFANITEQDFSTEDKPDYYLLAGELSGFTKVFSELSQNKLTNVLCLSVKISDKELESLDGEVRESLKALIVKKQLTAFNQKSAEAIQHFFKVEAPEITGSLLSFSQFSKIPNCETRPVYFADSGLSEAENRKVYLSVNAKEQTLFIANTFKDLEGGAIPGITTLVSPLFPQYYADALATASHIYTSSLAAVFFAIAHSISFTYTGIDDSWVGNEETQKKVPTYKKETTVFLTRHGISQIKLVEQTESNANQAVFASISDSNYYPFLRGWILNTISFVSSPVFHVLALDEGVKELTQRDFPDVKIHVHLLKDLWTEEELPEILKRSIGVRAFSSKPRLIKKALEIDGLPVLYSDSDVYFFFSPLELLNDLGKQNVLLFPHWNEHKKEARHDGLFNAGMIAVNQDAKEFLNWWSDACYLDCAVDSLDGSVGDQGYLDFAHVYFKGVKSYPKADQDVARWNIRSLGVTRTEAPDWIPCLANGAKVKTFHAAFIDGLGIFECKAVWDQLCSFFSTHLKEDATKHFVSVTLAQQSRHWVGLSRALRFEKLLTKPKSIHPLSTVRDFFLKPGVKAVLDFLFGLKNKTPLCESAETPRTLPADSPWAQFQRKRFLESQMNFENQKITARAVNSRHS